MTADHSGALTSAPTIAASIRRPSAAWIATMAANANP
jgi:hypothetical protein